MTKLDGSPSVSQTAGSMSHLLDRSNPASLRSESSNLDVGWAERRRGFRATLYSREWLLATALYVLFAILAATTFLS